MFTDVVAIDCEMVEVGVKWREDALARVSLVNESGDCILDRYVKPKKPVTDYRTHCSGITKRQLETLGGDFDSVREEVKNILKGKILVGHSLHYDLAVLGLNHPKEKIIDTATYLPFEKMNNNKTPPLKFLARLLLNKNIQYQGHSSVEDAKTVMEIYRKYKREFTETNNQQ